MMKQWRLSLLITFVPTVVVSALREFPLLLFVCDDLKHSFGGWLSEIKLILFFCFFVGVDRLGWFVFNINHTSKQYLQEGLYGSDVGSQLISLKIIKSKQLILYSRCFELNSSF